mgnify:CR=1 FL=1
MIISPHNEQIRYEFARAFNEHRVARGLDPIEFERAEQAIAAGMDKVLLTGSAATGREVLAELARRERRPVVHDPGHRLDHPVPAVSLSRPRPERRP